MIPINSSNNAWVQSVVKLHRSAERRKSKQFLVEGTNLVGEAINSKWPLESIGATPSWLDIHRDIIEKCAKACSIRCVEDRVLRSMATTVSPDGVIAIARMQDPLPPAIPTLGILVDALQDPGNLGTLIRSVVATGADGIFLGEGTVDAFHPKVLRSTAGQWFKSPPRDVDLIPWIETCLARGVRIMATRATGKPYWDCDLRQPTLLVLGNEGSGISPAVLEKASDIVSIPMQSGVESLNVAMTGTLLLYEAIRQRKYPAKT
ncbi:MAG: RNA methyltransferase [Planctomycetes bacterium]|nr:RNA methyltransferase [Planctomycetota bacterium]